MTSEDKLTGDKLYRHLLDTMNSTPSAFALDIPNTRDVWAMGPDYFNECFKYLTPGSGMPVMQYIGGTPYLFGLEVVIVEPGVKPRRDIFFEP